MTICSGDCLKLADPIAELNPLNDLRLAALSVELAPFLMRRHHQLERPGQTGRAAEASAGALRSVPDGRACAFDQV